MLELLARRNVGQRAKKSHPLGAPHRRRSRYSNISFPTGGGGVAALERGWGWIRKEDDCPPIM